MENSGVSGNSGPGFLLFNIIREELYMNNKVKVDSDSHFKIGDADSYNEVVDYFDKYTQRFTRHLLGPMLEMADVQPDQCVLDVGTGTGVVALDVAAKLGDNGNVIGIDLSDGMLARANEKAESMGLSERAQFLKMDAEALEFDNNSFDAVLSLYALRHFPNPRQALAEMYRVLSPGGTIVIGVGSAPRLLTRDGVKAAFYRLTALFRRLLGRGDYEACQYLDNLVDRHLPKSETGNAEWTDHHTEYSGSVSDMLKRTGFENVKSDWFGQRSVIESPEEFWELQLTFSSVARKRIGSCDQGLVVDLKRIFLNECNAHMARGGRLVYATGATVVYASRG